MKGCLESIFVLIVGIVAAAVLIWKALQEPAAMPSGPPVPLSEAAKAEFETQRRQFQTSEDYQKRLAAQNLSEFALKQRIAQAVETQHKLEAGLAQVTEAQARAWFDAHREELRIPETFHAAHVFLTRHDKAKPDREPEIRAIERQIASGAITFSQAAARYSEDDRTKTLAGDLGWFSADRMPPELIATVRQLSTGQLSAPFQSKLGWHLVKLVDRKPSRLPAFEEARAEIIASLEIVARR